MKKFAYLGAVLCLIMMTACQRDIPKPESKDMQLGINKVFAASGYEAAGEDPFFVRYQVKSKDVYIECIVKGVTFRNGAKMILSVDGKKTKEINQAAFIVKGLNTGTHQLKLELIKEKEHTVTASKEIKVIIP